MVELDIPIGEREVRKESIGVLEVTFNEGQFIDGRKPKIGAEIRTQGSIWIVSEPEEEDFTEKDLKDIDDALELSTSGPVDF